MATYYVDYGSGNDGNPGTIGSPFKTIQHASFVSGPGDIINLRAGTYPGFWVENSGTAGNKITFRAYNDESVTLDASLGTVSGGIFGAVTVSVLGVQYITLEGFTATGNDALAEFEIYDASFIDVIDCTATYANSTGIGIYAESHDILIQGCISTQNSQVNWPRGSVVGDWGAGLISAYGNYNISFIENFVYYNHGEGMTLGAHTYNSTARGNVVSDNWSVNHYIESSQNIVSDSNIIYTTDAAKADELPLSNPVGIALTRGDNSGGFSGADTYLTNIILINNIVRNTDWSILRYHIGGTSGPDTGWIIANNTLILDDGPAIKLGSGADSLEIQIYNNLIAGSLTNESSDWAFINFTITPSLTIGNNTYYSTDLVRWIRAGTNYYDSGSWISATGESNLLETIPGFNDPSTNFPVLWSGGDPTTIRALSFTYFGLASGSGSINTGITVPEVTEDANGIARVPFNYDRGVYESGGAMPSGFTAPMHQFSIEAVSVSPGGFTTPRHQLDIEANATTPAGGGFTRSTRAATGTVVVNGSTTVYLGYRPKYGEFSGLYPSDDGVFSWGFTDFVSQYGQGITNTSDGRLYAQSNVAVLIIASDYTHIYKASVAATDTGFTITITDQDGDPVSGFIVSYHVIGGSGVEASLQFVNMGTGMTGLKTITGAGFTPNLARFMPTYSDISMDGTEAGPV